ncbi:MAG: (d)CMP kinase [Mariprofundaceae bacterium]|nr:(d)CMP kinase [Mariprofundaceae bacterium]
MSWTPSSGLQVAIDGPSGSGKGTVAAMLAAELGLPVLDTGLLYRYVGCCAEQQGADIASETSVLEVLDGCLENMQWREQSIFVAGENWSARLRDEKTGASASMVAAMPQVRMRLLMAQRELAKHGCVMDGRDIGTVVLPDAKAKFFLTASLRARARRRWLQLQTLGGEASLDDILTDISMRDTQDAGRTHSPLKQAEDAVCIDSTTMRVDEVVDRMLAVMKRRGIAFRSGDTC